MTMRQHQVGFTLIGLMITVAIIGILATIAYPSYVQQVRESRRTEAVSLLMRAANEQAQYYAIHRTYAASMAALNLPAVTANQWYDVAVGAASNSAFTITATARGDQTNDSCDTFTIDQTGARWANSATVSPSSQISQACW